MNNPQTYCKRFSNGKTCILTVTTDQDGSLSLEANSENGAFGVGSSDATYREFRKWIDDVVIDDLLSKMSEVQKNDLAALALEEEINSVASAAAAWQTSTLD